MLQYFWKDSSEIPPELYTQNFSTVHIIWFFSILIFIILFVRFYRKRPESSKERIKKVLAVILISSETLVWIWKLIIGQYFLKYSLPLHLCGMSIYIEFLVVFGNRSVILKEFTYALSMPGAIFALLTPEWRYPFLTFQYIELVIFHSILVLLPVLFVWGDGFKPDYRRLPKVSVVFVFLIAVAFVANSLLGSNYMFIAFAPPGTILEVLEQQFGKGYLVPEFGILIFVWILLYLPRIIKSRKKAKMSEIPEMEKIQSPELENVQTVSK